VRAGKVAAQGDWIGSNYRAHMGLAPAPPWLGVAGLHDYRLGRPATGSKDRRHAAARYAKLVASGTGEALWDYALQQQSTWATRSSSSACSSSPR
jgi:hypothetical protein